MNKIERFREATAKLAEAAGKLAAAAAANKVSISHLDADQLDRHRETIDGIYRDVGQWLPPPTVVK